jgi:hypothetical protein
LTRAGCGCCLKSKTCSTRHQPQSAGEKRARTAHALYHMQAVWCKRHCSGVGTCGMVTSHMWATRFKYQCVDLGGLRATMSALSLTEASCGCCSKLKTCSTRHQPQSAGEGRQRHSSDSMEVLYGRNSGWLVLFRTSFSRVTATVSR